MTSPPLPAGFAIRLDDRTKRIDAGSLFGGQPARLLRLSGPGQAALAELLSGPVRTAAAGTLARRLTDSGVAHPLPPASRPGAESAEITVVIPVRDRVGMLARCLAAQGRQYPVLVVDDASTDPAAIAAVAAEHGATVLRRLVNGGPAAARNTGLSQVGTEFVALLDSDCVPPAGWLDRLVGHLADPLVAAVAPRVLALAQPSALGRYTAVRGNLDLGSEPARVLPLSRVSYVPTAALLVRRSAVIGLTGAAGPESAVFDEALRYGEDVDLIWRLHRAGWRVRYDPAVRVEHQEPAGWPELLGRRFHYGTSAAPLATRHPAAMPPLILHRWPALVVAAVLAGRPRVAVVAALGALVATGSALRRAGLPVRFAPQSAAQSAWHTWLGIGRYATQFGAPLLVAATLTGRPRRRLAAASLLAGGPLVQWCQRRPALDPVRYTAATIADDLAYGAGVLAGAAREHDLAAVRPAVARRNRAEPPRTHSAGLTEQRPLNL